MGWGRIKQKTKRELVISFQRKIMQLKAEGGEITLGYQLDGFLILARLRGRPRPEISVF